jgi:hypothetical protein
MTIDNDQYTAARKKRMGRMMVFSRDSVAVLLLAILMAFVLGIPQAWPAPVEKDAAAGDEDSYLYGAAAGEVYIFSSTATGDVNGDGLPDLVMGHDKGDDFYSGRVYVYYGRTSLDPLVDLGTGADVTITGYLGSCTETTSMISSSERI